MATSNAPFRGMLDTNVTCDISLSVVTQGGVRVFFYTGGCRNLWRNSSISLLRGSTLLKSK